MLRLYQISFFLCFICFYSTSQSYKFYDCEKELNFNGNDVYAITEGKNHRIWVSTKQGVYFLEKNKFVEYVLPQKINPEIWSIKADPEGNIWLMSYDKYVSYIDTNNLLHTLPQTFEGSLKNIVFLNQKVYLGYVGNKQNQIYEYSLKHNKVTRLYGIEKNGEALVNKNASKELILFNSLNRNLTTYNPVTKQTSFLSKKNEIKYSNIFSKRYYSGQDRFTHYTLFELFKLGFFPSKNKLKLNNNYINFENFVVSSDGKEIAFKTKNNIVCLNKNGVRNNLAERILQDLTLKNGYIPIFYIDSLHNIWVIENGNLIFYANYINGIEKKYTTRPSSLFIPKNDSVFFLIEKKKLIQLHNGNKKLLLNIKNSAKNIKVLNNYIVTLLEHKTIFFDLTSKKNIEYTFDSKDVFFHQDTFFVISPYKITKLNNKLEFINDKALENRMSASFLFKNKLYVASVLGDIWEYHNGNKKKICSITKNINNIFCDNDGYLYASTTNGDVYMINKNGDLKQLNIPNKKVKIVKITNFNHFICIATQKSGVYFFKKGQFQFQFNKKNFLQKEKIKDISVIDSNLYVLTDYNLIKANIPFLHKKLTKQQNISIYSDSANTITRHKFRFYENDIIKFTIEHKNVTNYLLQNIAYKLSGNETKNKWSNLNGNEILLNYLPKGDYLLELKNNNIGNSITLISFSVIKPYYKSLWFLILIIILAFSCFSFLFIRYIKKQSANKLQLARLEIQSIQAQINPHFFSNALLSIQYLVNTNNIVSANKYLNKFAKLMRQTMATVNWFEHSVKKEIDIIENYLVLEKLRVPNLNYTIKTLGNLNISNELIPSLIMQPLVENAIKHGIMPNNKSGNVEIKFIFEAPNTLICVVLDDGVGLSKKKNKGSQGLALVEAKLHQVAKKNKWLATFSLNTITENNRLKTQAMIIIKK